MGQAKKKIEVKVSLQEIAKRRRAYVRSIPERLLKGLAGAFLFLPFTMIAFSAHCFDKNEWPWSYHL